MPLTAATRSPLSDKQICSLRESSARVNVWEGSIRSGKTNASLLRWLIFCATAPRGGELVVIARTRETAGRNVFGPLQDRALFGDIAAHVNYTPGAPTATILGRTIHVIGASDSKAEKIIRGMTVAGAYVDEITTIHTEEFFTQLLGRMSVPGAQLFGTTNPDNPAHWLKRKYLDRIGELDGWRSWHFLMRDNPSLTDEYIASVEREFTGLWHRRFILGEWVAAEGAVFDMWDPDKHVVSWDALPPMRRLIGVGIDAGTQHATTALMLGIGYDRRLYMVDELGLDPSKSQIRLTPSEQGRKIKQWLGGHHLPEEYGLKPEWIVADQAGAWLRQTLFDEQDIATEPADKDVLCGISTMASLLGDGKRCRQRMAAGYPLTRPGKGSSAPTLDGSLPCPGPCGGGSSANPHAATNAARNSSTRSPPQSARVGGPRSAAALRHDRLLAADDQQL